MDIMEIGKRIVQAIQESDNVAANQLILEFQGKALDLQNANHELRRMVEEVEARAKAVDELRFDGKFSGE